MKIRISLSTTEPALIQKPQHVSMFKLSKIVPGVHDKDAIYLIPYQEIGGGPTKDLLFFRSLKLTGYDWRPELLKHLERSGLHIFCNTSHQYPDEVKSTLVDAGYTLVPIEVSLEKWEALQRPASKVKEVLGQPVSDYYGRTRYLWKHHNASFSEWETKFVRSIGERLSKQLALTDSQAAQLERLFQKYAVPMTAVAGAYADDDLTTLRSGFTAFDPSAERPSAGSTSGQPKRKKKTISEMHEEAERKKRKLEKKKKKDKLERERERQKDNPKDSGAVVDKSIST